MNLLVTKMFTKWFSTAILLVCVSFFSCDLLLGSNPQDGPTIPNILSTQDSIAVKHILDANGLTTKKVRDVIDLEHSSIISIRLDSLGLTSFILNGWFDSIASAPGIKLRYNNIDTLIISDSLYNYVGLSLEHNKLTEISKNIGLLRGPVALGIAYNQIQTISPEILKCNVTYINVQNNLICVASDTIANLLSKYNGSWRDSQVCN